ncbi:hypothetical protein F4604DRAFT_1880415 [Suillus subluteus]|nr:hypothetical protein F4604DRAFT_1880415 [Suillus subluteus]
MSQETQHRGACTVCAHNVCIKQLQNVSASKVPLHLLRNDCLPAHTLPCLSNCWALADLQICHQCHVVLISKHPHQPVNSLANFQYYGYERLPLTVAYAFAKASAYDLMLPSGYWASEESSQRYNQGNVAIRPQDIPQLQNMLPPSQDDLRNAMCIIFAGHKEKPSRDMVKQMRLVLVTKSIVKTLIDFLQSGVSYSQENMDVLFDDVDTDVDTSIPQALQVCHLPRDDVVNQFCLLESCDIGISDDLDASDIAIEAIGFTKGDHSETSREKMKLHALAHVLDHKKIILSNAGSHFVSDNDPGLINTMEAQVKNLDPNFAFICWNMMQKKEVNTNTTFQISTSLQHTLGQELRDWMCSEKKAAKLLWWLHASARSLKGSAAYKLCCRNEICSLMKKFSTPAFLIPTIVGVELEEWIAKMIASHPDHGPGIFGHCQAYYGMVEAQGRGTLHCHFLLWIKGNPSPQALHDRMASEQGFSARMFDCELPYDTGPIPETEEMDPRLEMPLQAADMDEDSFKHEFMSFLSCLAVECNWHVHNNTCFKHLKNGEPRDDTTCRMCLDGSTQDVTIIDPERHVNNFTDLILFLMQCNTDTQFIGSGEAVKVTVDLPLHMYEGERTLITKIVNVITGKQEMSHQQVMSYLVGSGDYYTSHVFHAFKCEETQVDMDAFNEALFADATLDGEDVESRLDGGLFVIAGGSQSEQVISKGTDTYLMSNNKQGRLPEFATLMRAAKKCKRPVNVSSLDAKVKQARIAQQETEPALNLTQMEEDAEITSVYHHPELSVMDKEIILEQIIQEFGLSDNEEQEMNL